MDSKTGLHWRILVNGLSWRPRNNDILLRQRGIFEASGGLYSAVEIRFYWRTR